LLAPGAAAPQRGLLEESPEHWGLEPQQSSAAVQQQQTAAVEHQQVLVEQQSEPASEILVNLSL